MDRSLRRDVVHGRVRFVLTGDLDMSTAAGHTALAGALGIDQAWLLLTRQVHGTRVLQARSPWPGQQPEADGVVVAVVGCAAGVRAADCMPLLLADPVRGVAAAVHVGRRGLLGGVVQAAVEAMRAAGAEQLLALAGPTVCGRCYEVSDELARAAGTVVAAAETTTAWGTPAIDIPAGVRSQLSHAAAGSGLPLEQDDSWQECTVEAAVLSSYRRDATTRRHAGAVLVLP